MNSISCSEATIYGLADSLVQLRFRAEIAWCSEKDSDEVPARVDAAVGRAIQCLDDLIASKQNAKSNTLGERLRDAVAAAWDDYRRAWTGNRRRQALEWWRRTLADDDCEKRSYAISKSPLADHAWKELDRLTVEFRDALVGDLRTCFELSTALAEELYPTELRERRIEQLDVTELRYLTVELDRRVNHAVSSLSPKFAGLRGLNCDLSNETVVTAMTKVSRLHAAVLRCLNYETASEMSEGQSPNPTVALQHEDTSKSARHSDDFRSVYWFGTEYSFSPNQAACVKILWEHWERKTPDVSGVYILDAAGSNSTRLDHVFRDSEAWQTMIVSLKNNKGAYRLKSPDLSQS